MIVCDAPGADVDAACERLRPRGYECVIVCARARHAGHRAWPALQRRPAVVAAPADVAAVVEHCVVRYASMAFAEPAPPTPPKEREKRDSLLCDGDTVDAVLGSVFD